MVRKPRGGAEARSLGNGRRRQSTDIICLCNAHGLGGAQLDAGLLASEFQQRGYTAEVIFLFNRETEADVGASSVVVVGQIRPSTNLAWMRLITQAIVQIIKRRPQVIIGLQPGANIVGAVAARFLRGCQMVATQRNPSDRQSGAAARTEKLIGSTNLYRRNVAISDAVKQSFDSYPVRYRAKLTLVPNGTPALDDIGEGQAECRQILGMPEAGFILGCIGRLHPQKNIGFALEVLTHVPEAILILAGDGEERLALEQRALALGVRDRVTFLGSLTGKNITRFYRSLDVLLFPSIYEGFGRVLAEGMSQGVAIVASDLPITREVGQKAIIRREFDPLLWRDAIREIRSKPELKGFLGEEAKVRSSAFSVQAMVDGYLSAAGLAVSRNSAAEEVSPESTNAS